MKYTLPQILAQTFRTVQYNPGLASALNEALNSRTETEYNAAIQEATTILAGYNQFGRPSTNYLGLPVFMPLVLGYEEKELVLENAFVEVRNQKNIVTTVVQGNDQEVIEFINNGTPSVVVSGILSTRGYKYPIDEVEAFNEFMIQKSSLKIAHEKVNALGIYDIVITDYDLPTSPFVNFQPFQFTAKRDQPINLRLR
ncbi:MAG: DUF6046 domain-containing protein [Crocinitomicaceae bacterium]|jgi:hypothetical protein|nr:DUF6046 domain-containing protein [Crocinitomicaceae bacterium]